MRLNVKDLRIANLLEHNGDIREISTLHDDNTLRFKDGNSSIGCFKATIDTIKPIPLTEEILLKCGFVDESNGYRATGHSVSWKLTINESCIITLYDGESYNSDANSWGYKIPYYPNVCFYLHQLQNLYFALTNEELIINLKKA